MCFKGAFAPLVSQRNSRHYSFYIRSVKMNLDFEHESWVQATCLRQKWSKYCFRTFRRIVFFKGKSNKLMFFLFCFEDTAGCTADVCVNNCNILDNCCIVYRERTLSCNKRNVRRANLFFADFDYVTGRENCVLQCAQVRRRIRPLHWCWSRMYKVCIDSIERKNYNRSQIMYTCVCVCV